jgi:hypothetical protein
MTSDGVYYWFGDYLHIDGMATNDAGYTVDFMRVECVVEDLDTETSVRGSGIPGAYAVPAGGTAPFGVTIYLPGLGDSDLDIAVTSIGAAATPPSPTPMTLVRRDVRLQSGQRIYSCVYRNDSEKDIESPRLGGWELDSEGDLVDTLCISADLKIPPKGLWATEVAGSMSDTRPGTVKMSCEALPIVGGRLNGTVTSGGVALLGAVVSGSGFSVEARYNGAYECRSIAPGLQTVSYSHPGYLTQAYPVTITLGGRATKDVELIVSPSLARSPSGASKSYRRRRGKAKYSLAATVRGADGFPVGGVKVVLQRSKNGRTRWASEGAALRSDENGRVSRTLVSKKKSTVYYRWAVVRQPGVNGTPRTSRQRIAVR